MIEGGLKQTTSRLAVAAAAGLFTGGIALTPVQAADFGGDCCADLEERVAELEATTVRKGNRRVSVKLSGQIIRQLLWWDDGHDDDLYLTDGGFTHSRFRISGSATISPGRTAGFIYEHDFLVSNDPNSVSNCDGNDVGAHCTKVANGNSTNSQRFADLWVADDRLGKVSLGQGNTASNGTSEVDLSGTKVLASSLMDANADGMLFRTTAGAFGPSIGGSITNLDGGSRRDRIRYDTPSLGGFTLSTSYAADDWVDVALRFKKEWNSVRCAAAVAYSHSTDDKDYDYELFNGSASCLHTPSGLNLTFAAGEQDFASSTHNLGAVVDENDFEFWYVKGGIYRRWNAHGKTAISVAYGEYEADSVSTNANSDTDALEIAIVQNIDAAAMQLYAAYYHFEYDENTATSYEDFDAVISGARIKF